jgi:predicted amidophosphoribosyltransferase
MATFQQCQSAYDRVSPPDDICPVCGRESSVDCVCTEVIEQLNREGGRRV